MRRATAKKELTVRAGEKIRAKNSQKACSQGKSSWPLRRGRVRGTVGAERDGLGPRRKLSCESRRGKLCVRARQKLVSAQIYHPRSDSCFGPTARDEPTLVGQPLAGQRRVAGERGIGSAGTPRRKGQAAFFPLPSTNSARDDAHLHADSRCRRQLQNWNAIGWRGCNLQLAGRAGDAGQRQGRQQQQQQHKVQCWRPSHFCQRALSSNTKGRCAGSLGLHPPFCFFRRIKCRDP